MLPEYDLVCIGFGTDSLAFAAALADQNIDKRVLFVEKESRFREHVTSLLSKHAVCATFLRDLVTLQNPRSEFTFVNYLHTTNQLVGFTNLSQLAPSRLLAGKYLEWVAERIEKLGWVSFNQDVVRIRPLKPNALSQVERWAIDMRNTSSGSLSAIRSKRVIVANGMSPHLPMPLAAPEVSSFVTHARDCGKVLEHLHNRNDQLDIAVVGADQEAAEIFEHLQHTPGQHRATMYIPDTALRVGDNTCFAQEIIDGPGTTLRHLPPEVRKRFLATKVSSENPTIALETLESVYSELYAQKVSQPDKQKWRFALENLSEVVGAEREQNKIRLITRDRQTGAKKKSSHAFDLVVAATGYDSAPDAAMMDPVKPLLDGNGIVNVDAEYHVNLRRGIIGSGCGLWVLGSLDDRNTRRDDFNLTSQRASIAVRSVLKHMENEDKMEQRSGQFAML